MNEGGTLPRIERHCIDITLGVCGGRGGSIPHYGPARLRDSHDVTLTGSMARRRASGRFPGSDSAIAQHAMRCPGPTDIEQLLEINGIVFRCLQNALAIVRMSRYLIACKKTGPDPGPRCAECQGCRKPTTVGDTPCCYNRDWPDRIDHCGNERHRCDFSTHMAAGFPSLCDNDVNATTLPHGALPQPC